MGLYYIGQKSRQIKRQSGLGAQFERIREKKKRAAEKADLDAARVGLLKQLQNRAEQTSSAVPEAETRQEAKQEIAAPSVSNPPGTEATEVKPNASNSNSRGRDGTQRRK